MSLPASGPPLLTVAESGHQSAPCPERLGLSYGCSLRFCSLPKLLLNFISEQHFPEKPALKPFSDSCEKESFILVLSLIKWCT